MKEFGRSATRMDSIMITIILQMKIAMTIPMLHFHPVMRQRLHLLIPTQKAFQMKTVRATLMPWERVLMYEK